MKDFRGYLLLVVLIIGIGFLLCSLCSLSFHIQEWNTVSHILKWLFIFLVLLSFILYISVAHTRNQSEEDRIRGTVRKEFKSSVKYAVRNNADMIGNPLFGGLIIQHAIGSCYQKLQNNSSLSYKRYDYNYITNYNRILEEECKRALNKYLKL